MKGKRRVLIFRHGETDWNVQERFQGHMDIPLNDQGRNQARELAPKLTHLQLEAILASDLSRAYETGKIVADALQIPIFQDADLREAHLGEAQGLTRPEIEFKFGLELATKWRSWKAVDADISYPGGETGEAIRTRAFQAMERFLKAQPFQSIGVASHGGVIRRVMQYLLPKHAGPVPIPNGVHYELHFDPESGEWATTFEIPRAH